VTPRGIRNFNPGNIRHSRTLWQGEADVQADDSFVTFKAPEWGLRAIAKILLTYQKSGLNTVRKIISRWAPPNENDTEAYVAAVAAAVGVKPDAVLNVSASNVMAALVKAIVRHENGLQPYADAVVTEGLELAGIIIPASRKTA
jgi:hypothetical protein